MQDQPNENGSPDPVAAAAEAVRRARAEFQDAMDLYRKARQDAQERWDKVRKTTVGDLIDRGLDVVRKYPGTGLLAGVLAGLLLGRRLRK